MCELVQEQNTTKSTVKWHMCSMRNDIQIYSVLLTVMSESDSIVIHMRNNKTVHTEFITWLRCRSYKLTEKLDGSRIKGLCHSIFQNRRYIISNS